MAGVDRVMEAGNALRLRSGGCRQRTVPSGTHDMRPCLGRWYPSSSQGVSGRVKLIWPVAGRGRRRKQHIPDTLSRPAEDMLANASKNELAKRHEGPAESSLCRCSRADRRWTSAMDQGQGQQQTKHSSPANTECRERRNIISSSAKLNAIEREKLVTFRKRGRDDEDGRRAGERILRS